MGNGGADAFAYNAGYGQLEINEDAGSSDSTAVLQLGSGITPAQLTVKSDSSGYLILSDGMAGDQVTIDQQLTLGSAGNQEFGVAEVVFADGSTLSRQQLTSLAFIGTPGADDLYGANSTGTFDGKGAPAGTQDYEENRGGADTFVFNAGYGQLEISSYSSDILDATTLQLGTGITVAQTSVTADRYGDIILVDGITGDRIQIDEMMSGSGVTRVQFADGTLWTRDHVVTLATTGTLGADVLYGSRNAAIFDGKGAPAGTQDYERGQSGADSFVYKPGYGRLEISEDAGFFKTSTAVLQLGSGITPAQVVATADSSGNVLLTDGVIGDQVKIDGLLTPGYAGYAQYGIARVVFADGTTWTRDRVVQMASNAASDPGPALTPATVAKVGHGQTVQAGTVAPGTSGDALTLATVTAGRGALSLAGGVLSYAAPTAGGADSVGYTVTDQLGNVVAGTFVTQVDAGPKAGSGLLTVGHGATQDVTTLLAGLVTPGLAGDTETLTAVTSANGSAALLNGAVSYTAPAAGADTITYTATDQLGEASTGSVAVTVDGGPVITSTLPAKVGHGQTVRVGTIAPGIAGDTLALGIATPGHGTLGLDGGTLTYTASATAGPDSIGYTVTDQFGDTVAGTFSTNVDAGPAAGVGTLLIGHGQKANLTSLVNGLVTPGLAGDAETISAVSAKSGQASLDVGTGAISYVAPASGTDTITYAVADQLGDTTTGTVGVTINPGPAAAPLSRTAPLGSSVNLTSVILSAAIPGLQGDTLAITGDSTSGTLGTVALVDGQLTYTASGSGLQDIPQNGTMSDSFAYSVSDQYGDVASGTVSLTVTNPVPKLLTVSSGGSLKDAAGNTWTLTSNGDVNENGTPVPNGSGTAQFTIANDVEYGLDAQGSGWYAYSPASQTWANSAPPPGLYPPPTVRGLTSDRGGLLKDSAGNIWTLTAGGDVNENGTPAPDGSNTAEFTIINNVDYGLDAGGTGWYTYAPATQTWASAAAPTVTIPQSTASATVSLNSVLVNAAAGNHTMFVSGSGNTINLTGGTETITDLGGTNTYVIPAAGKGYDTFTTDVLNLNDVLDLRPALKATNWTGTASTLSRYLSVADTPQGATLSISPTSGGTKTAIAFIGGADTTNLSTLLTHAITK